MTLGEFLGKAYQPTIFNVYLTNAYDQNIFLWNGTVKTLTSPKCDEVLPHLRDEVEYWKALETNFIVVLVGDKHYNERLEVPWKSLCQIVKELTNE